MIVGLLDHYTKNLEDSQKEFDETVLSKPKIIQDSS